ncbi:MAG: helix-turn-helix domain-containing protein [Nitrososphaerales archaeon]
MIEAVISIKPPHSWIRNVLIKYPAMIRVLDCKAIEGKEGVQELFQIVTLIHISDELIDDLRRDEYVYDVDIISNRRGKITGSLKTYRCTACRIFAASNCHIISMRTRADGMIEWEIFARSNSLRDLMNRLDEQSVKAKIERISNLKGMNALTDRQEKILRIALEKGYYDFPRKTTLSELATSLGIAKSTLSEILRRGERRTLIERFKGYQL